jgi:hypothetical protein
MLVSFGLGQTSMAQTAILLSACGGRRGASIYGPLSFFMLTKDLGPISYSKQRLPTICLKSKKQPNT